MGACRQRDRDLGRLLAPGWQDFMALLERFATLDELGLADAV